MKFIQQFQWKHVLLSLLILCVPVLSSAAESVFFARPKCRNGKITLPLTPLSEPHTAPPSCRAILPAGSKSEKKAGIYSRQKKYPASLQDNLNISLCNDVYAAVFCKEKLYVEFAGIVSCIANPLGINIFHAS